MRAAAVALLEGYKAVAQTSLQVYPGRPLTLNPPTAFIDRISEKVEHVGPVRRRRMPTVQVVVLHGIFDSAEAVAQGDAFVDGFLNYVVEQYHAAGVNTTLGVRETADDPNYVPDWLPPNRQQQYYATVIALEGLALD